MKRRSFVKNSAILGSISLTGLPLNKQAEFLRTEKKESAPLCITMWDFSWLERRWPGAGYENWDKALDELVERGYNAVRIDAYPHLVATDPEKVWTLLPHWTVQDWGSPAINKVQVQPSLNEFIAKCHDRKIKVGLSTWYRKDVDDIRMKINSPETMAEQWIKTLESIHKAGLTDAILYTDLCNEWPGDAWAPFFTNNPPELTWGAWDTSNSINWMQKSIDLVRNEFPEIPLCYSFDANDPLKFKDTNTEFLDFLEPHIWMVQANSGEFYKKAGYKYDLFEHESYNNLVKNGEKLYREKPGYWQNLLKDLIKSVAKVSEDTGHPLITTECWGVVDYKDWPLLSWDWVKELCKTGVL
ncbi:MAG: cellulase-like family protein, partial [Bacteroidales bacterium]